MSKRLEVPISSLNILILSSLPPIVLTEQGQTILTFSMWYVGKLQSGFHKVIVIRAAESSNTKTDGQLHSPYSHCCCLIDNLRSPGNEWDHQQRTLHFRATHRQTKQLNTTVLWWLQWHQRHHVCTDLLFWHQSGMICERYDDDASCQMSLRWWKQCPECWKVL